MCNMGALGLVIGPVKEETAGQGTFAETVVPMFLAIPNDAIQRYLNPNHPAKKSGQLQLGQHPLEFRHHPIPC